MSSRWEILGQAQFPRAVLREEGVVDDGGLGLAAGKGRAGLLPLGVPGEFLPDGLLQIRRSGGVDGQDGGKPQLADNLMDKGVPVMGPWTVGK